MRDAVRLRLLEALERARQSGDLSGEEVPAFTVERPRDAAHGDLATNLAFQLARIERKAPARIAESLVAHLATDGEPVERAEVAGNGFLNLWLGASPLGELLRRVEAAGTSYGSSEVGAGQRALVEFVSANPTGPLHVGHGRGAAVGDALANLLAAVGYEVVREYYVNDAGNQMHTLGRSVYLRARELAGHTIEYPENYYQGDYVRDIARDLRLEDPALGEDEDPPLETIAALGDRAGRVIEDGIRDDLEALGVRFDVWTRESRFNRGADDDVVGRTLERLRGEGVVCRKEGEGDAWWFETTRHSDDDKDRVVVKSDGSRTYFAADIAYHADKVDRGFARIVDVWGRDHAGYVERMRAAMKVLGAEAVDFDVVLVHLVNLLRGGVKVQMSTRRAEYVTLREVVDEVGPDVARFVFLTRGNEATLDFDIEVAKSQANENPVYYVQYMHTRCCSIERKAAEQGADIPAAADVDAGTLAAPEERALLAMLDEFPSVVEGAAQSLEAHRITGWLEELARTFNSYYTRGTRDASLRVLGGDPGAQPARLVMIRLLRGVTERALALLGAAAPERM